MEPDQGAVDLVPGNAIQRDPPFSNVPLVERNDCEANDRREPENYWDQLLHKELQDRAAVIVDWIGGFTFGTGSEVLVEISFSNVLVCLSRKEPHRKRKDPQARRFGKADPEVLLVKAIHADDYTHGLFSYSQESLPSSIGSVIVDGVVEGSEDVTITDETGHIEIYPQIRDDDVHEALNQISPCLSETALYIVEKRHCVIVIPCSLIAIRDYPFLMHYLQRSVRGDHSLGDIATSWFFDGLRFEKAKRLGKQQCYIVRAAADRNRALNEVTQVLPRAIAWNRLHGGFFPIAIKPPYTGKVSIHGSFFDYKGKHRLIRVCRAYVGAYPQHYLQRQYIQAPWLSLHPLIMSWHDPIRNSSAQSAKYYLNRRRKALAELKQSLD